MKQADQAQIAALQRSIASIDKKLAQPHWSQSARMTMQNLKSRQEIAIKLLQGKKR